MTKEFILQEIKRTAIANGGIPLGRQRFEDETGIKSCDWFGKLWARWGEAVEEAGFQPNQLTPAIEKSELLRRYADFVLEVKAVASTRRYSTEEET